MGKSKRKLDIQWLYLCWFGLIFSTLIIGAIGAIVKGDPVATVLKWGIVSDFTIFAIALYIIGSCAAVMILYLFLRRKGLGWNTVGLKGKLSLRLISYVLMGVIIACILYYLVETVLKTVGVSMYWGGAKDSHVYLNSLPDIFIVISLAVIIGPVTEEIIFRGYVLTMFIERGHKTLVAVILSALVFTSVHIFFGLGVLIFIFLWSFIPSFLYLKFKSLYPAILLHGINNLIAWVIIPVIV